MFVTGSSPHCDKDSGTPVFFWTNHLLRPVLTLANRVFPSQVRLPQPPLWLWGVPHRASQFPSRHPLTCGDSGSFLNGPRPDSSAGATGTTIVVENGLRKSGAATGAISSAGLSVVAGASPGTPRARTSRRRRGAEQRGVRGRDSRSGRSRLRRDGRRKRGWDGRREDPRGQGGNEAGAVDDGFDGCDLMTTPSSTATAERVSRSRASSPASGSAAVEMRRAVIMAGVRGSRSYASATGRSPVVPWASFSGRDSREPPAFPWCLGTYVVFFPLLAAERESGALGHPSGNGISTLTEDLTAVGEGDP